MADQNFEGGCLCGAVRYRAEGEPDATNLCYCTQCRRQTGSAMPAFATWKADRITVLRGEPAAFRATDQAVRHFCRDCGSPLFWRENGSSSIDVFLGTLDRPKAVRAPDDQIWTVHRLPWVPPLPEVPVRAGPWQEQD